MIDSPLPYPAEAIARLRERATLALERHEYATPDVVPADLDALLDYAEKAREAMRWRPIESAPKDRAVLLAFPSEDTGYVAISPPMCIAYWDQYYAPGGYGYIGDGMSPWVAIHSGNTVDNLYSGEPTHWLPLPPAPDSEAKR